MLSVTSAQLDAWMAALMFPLVRLLGLAMAAPVFSNRGVPMQVRLAIGLAIAMAVLPALPPMPAVAPGSGLGMAIMAQQIFIGIGVGLMMRLVFGAVDLAVIERLVGSIGNLGVAQCRRLLVVCLSRHRLGVNIVIERIRHLRAHAFGHGRANSGRCRRLFWRSDGATETGDLWPDGD